jgi:flagellar motor component MotA
MLRILFAVFGCATLLIAISINSSFSMFINIPSLLFIFLIPLFFTLAYHHPFELSKAVLDALSGQPIQKHTSESHQYVLSTLRLITSASGVMGSLIGLINMLANMDDPKNIGPAMAMALLTALYAVMVSELLIAPLINRLKQKSSAPTSSQALLKPTIITLVSIPLTVMMCIVLFTFVNV